MCAFQNVAGEYEPPVGAGHRYFVSSVSGKVYAYLQVGAVYQFGAVVLAGVVELVGMVEGKTSPHLVECKVKRLLRQGVVAVNACKCTATRPLRLVEGFYGLAFQKIGVAILPARRARPSIRFLLYRLWQCASSFHC